MTQVMTTKIFSGGKRKFTIFNINDFEYLDQKVINFVLSFFGTVFYIYEE